MVQLHGPVLSDCHLDVAGPLVPEGYSFAMITTKIHFLNVKNEQMNYTLAAATCQGDGRGSLPIDDRGQAWHDFLTRYMGPASVDESGLWIGGSRLSASKVYTWSDGKNIPLIVNEGFERKVLGFVFPRTVSILTRAKIHAGTSFEMPCSNMKMYAIGSGMEIT